MKRPLVSLPVCRSRSCDSRGGHVCLSRWYANTPNPVTAEFCAQCRYADKEPPALPPALPCVHRSGFLMGQEETQQNALNLFRCSVHRRCAVVGDNVPVPDKVKRCGNCPDYLARDLHVPDSARMRRQADSCLRALPSYPRGRYRGRGVVTAGGGDRYFASLYVTIRALRHVGCRLPIQVWYLGRKDEMPAERQALLAPLGVQCVDADQVRRRHPTRVLNGWELKVFATLHSSFQEVLFLDADCYPCRDPEFLFGLEDYRSRGAIFWPDMAVVDQRLKWPAFSVPDPKRLGSVESGQYVIHKRLSWRPLNLAWFYNNHSDYYYRYCYGDKHTLEVAWARCKQPFVMWQPNADWAQVAYLHPGPDRQPLFVHRCSDKFRLDRHEYTTPQSREGPFFQAQLPLERECWGWMAELAQALGRPLALPKIPRRRRHARSARLPLA